MCIFWRFRLYSLLWRSLFHLDLAEDSQGTRTGIRRDIKCASFLKFTWQVPTIALPRESMLSRGLPQYNFPLSVRIISWCSHWLIVFIRLSKALCYRRRRGYSSHEEIRLFAETINSSRSGVLVSLSFRSSSTSENSSNQENPFQSAIRFYRVEDGKGSLWSLRLCERRCLVSRCSSWYTHYRFCWAGKISFSERFRMRSYLSFSELYVREFFVCRTVVWFCGGTRVEVRENGLRSWTGEEWGGSLGMLAGHSVEVLSLSVGMTIRWKSVGRRECSLC